VLEPITGDITAQYFIPVVYADGTVLSFHQRADTNPMDFYMHKKNPGEGWTQTGRWTKFADGSNDLAGAVSPYVGRPAYVKLADGTERIAVGCITSTADGYTPAAGGRWGVMYVYSDDKGVTWKKADGTAVSLPIDMDAAARTDPILWPYRDWGTSVGHQHEHNVILKSDGRPVLVAFKTKFGTGATAKTIVSSGFSVFSWTGSAWSENELQDNTGNWDSSPAGEGFPTMVAISDTEWFIVSHRASPIDLGHPTQTLTIDHTTDSGSSYTTWLLPAATDGSGRLQTHHTITGHGSVYIAWWRTPTFTYVASDVMMAHVALADTEPVVDSGWHRRTLTAPTWTRRAVPPM
jgi:hypothetical protein